MANTHLHFSPEIYLLLRLTEKVRFKGAVQLLI